ncbi:LysR family transcriptional regulator [Skermania sp. ID1734]|uniref:LysR substrate-binding domain-containing protein n=1 Tax=Skermania sp. ID1734 TaxID=2597516 RepID=UPI00117D7F86|nr:LysR substrate-binding domain-containing protein [Skermania sp. ID1734]TSD95596.1 LysR family transcriptional regulator [Skermania sp. ID1734]
MDPHLRDLRYFVAVAEELHFTNAAQRLQIKQPTLSRQIRQLESQLGATLLDRDQRSVALTVAGRQLLERARQILALWDETAAELGSAQQTLRVGVQPGVGLGAIGDLVTAPDVQLEIRHAPWSDPSCGLATRTADVAAVWLPIPDLDRYDYRVLSVERRWVLLPEAHPLAAAERIDFADLLDEPFIALPAEAGATRDYWLAVADRGGRAPIIGAEAATPEETLEDVGMGLGVCLVAEGNLAMYQWPGVVARPVDGVTDCEFALVWRPDDERPELRAYVERVAG